MGFLACLFALFAGFLVFGIIGTAAFPLLAIAFAVALGFGLLWVAIALVGFVLRLVFGVVFGIGGLILGAFGLVFGLFLFVLVPLAIPVLFVLGILWLVRWAQRQSPPANAPRTLPPATA